MTPYFQLHVSYLHLSYLSGECAKWRALRAYAPTRQYFWRAKLFDAPYAPIFLTRQNVWRAKMFDSPKCLTPQNLWRAKIFDAPKFLTRQYFWRANIFDAPKLFTCQNSLHHARMYGLRTWIHRTLTPQSVLFCHPWASQSWDTPKNPIVKTSTYERFCESFFGCYPYVLT